LPATASVVVPVLKAPKTETRFEALARLNPRTGTKVSELCEDCGFDADAFIDAFAGILCMDVGLVYREDRKGFITSIKIHRDSWPRAKTMATAYIERTYGA